MPKTRYIYLIFLIKKRKRAHKHNILCLFFYLYLSRFFWFDFWSIYLYFGFWFRFYWVQLLYRYTKCIQKWFYICTFLEKEWFLSLKPKVQDLLRYIRYFSLYARANARFFFKELIYYLCLLENKLLSKCNLTKPDLPIIGTLTHRIFLFVNPNTHSFQKPFYTNTKRTHKKAYQYKKNTNTRMRLTIDLMNISSCGLWVSSRPEDWKSSLI